MEILLIILKDYGALGLVLMVGIFIILNSHFKLIIVIKNWFKWVLEYPRPRDNKKQKGASGVNPNKNEAEQKFPGPSEA